MISTPTGTLLLEAVGVSGDEGASVREAFGGQMTNSTMREGSEGV